MRTQSDPGSVPPFMLRHAENVRFRNGNIQSRGGHELVVSGLGALGAGDAAKVTLADFQTDPFKIYWVLDGCPGISSGTGFSVNALDHEQQTRFNRLIYYDGSTALISVGVFDARLYIGVDDTLKVLTLINPEYGIESLAVSGSEQAETIHVFDGFTITFLRAFDGKLFIGLDGGVGASQIATWDGLEIHDDDETAIDPPTAAIEWRDKLVVGLGNSSGLHVRDGGDYPGTWNAVAGAVSVHDLRSFQDNVYATGNAADLWKYDGSSFATVRTVAGSTMQGLEVFSEFLYYAYKSTGNAAILGTLDDAGAYVDVHKNLTTQSAEVRDPRRLVSYRGSLWVGATTAAAGAKFYQSPGLDTAGTYVIHTPSVASNADDVRQALVY